ncbi:MAG TPA: hypothetical protein VK861_11185, partial [Bacteroidales bacterium]|nr:hypothetical protein [Bacteroidales bacterium]
MKNSLLIILFFLMANGSLAAFHGYQIADTISFEAILSVEAETASEAELSQIVSQGYRFSRERYQYQVGAFRLRYNAEALFRIVRKHIDSDAIIIHEDGYYKVRVTKLPDVPQTVREKEEPIQIPAQSEPADTLQAADNTHFTQTPLDTSSIQQPDASDSGEIMAKAETGVRDILFIKGDSPWLRRITYLGKSIALVNALIITITVSIITMIMLLIVILLNRTRMEREGRLKQYLMEKYQTLIIDYLFGETTPEDFKAIASNTFRR